MPVASIKALFSGLKIITILVYVVQFLVLTGTFLHTDQSPVGPTVPAGIHGHPVALQEPIVGGPL